MSSRILLAGRDEALQQARQRMLQARGMDVATALDSEEFTDHLFAERYDAVVLCHSLRDSERERFSTLTKLYSPGTLVLLLADRSDQHFKFGDQTVLGTNPAALVNALATVGRAA